MQGTRVIIFLVLILSACAALVALNRSGTDSKAVDKPQRPETEQECTAKGGSWIFYDIRNFHFCAIKTSDAQKPCTDDEQCQGDCVPPERDDGPPGVCAPTLAIPGGCPEHFVKGQLISEPCI